jgi:uncharacterized protein YndB with AHSA1/START domain
MRPAGGRERGEALRREIRIAAAPETVLAFLTHPEKLLRWAGTHAESDPRPGGVRRTTINPGHVVSGEYVEVTPHRRLVFTFGWVDSPRMPPGSSVVEIALVPDDGGTALRLVHRAPAADHEGHGEVWDHYLPRLAVAASGGDPGSDPWAAPAATET